MYGLARPKFGDATYATLDPGMPSNRNVFQGCGANIMMSSRRSVGEAWVHSNPGTSTPLGHQAAVNPLDRLDCIEQELSRMMNASPPCPPHSVMYHPPPQPQVIFVPVAHHDMSTMSGMTGMNGMNNIAPLASSAHVGQSAHDGLLSVEHCQLMHAHTQLIQTMKQQGDTHTELMKAHGDLMKMHSRTLAGLTGTGTGSTGKTKRALVPAPKLGVIRLDYDYPPAEGDIDCPASYGYNVIYRVVPGMTFEMAQRGEFTEEVERAFAEGIKYLEQQGASAITGDCGFMMAFQVLARKIASKPVFMSSMVQCPVIAAAFDPNDHFLILTANSKSLKPHKEILLNSCGFNVNEDRFHIIGCQDVPGFDAVAKGEAVPVEIVQPGIVKMVIAELKKRPYIKAILLECTELPPYADALRATTELPIFDAITAADFYVNAFTDNQRFGISEWQEKFDGQHDEYTFGQNLTLNDRNRLVNKPGQTVKKQQPEKKHVEQITRKLARKQHPILGVVRLDYSYPPAHGDIDCPASYGYEVLFRCVPGLTFEMAQAGKMTRGVEKEFKLAIKWLESKGVSGITGDCGFMMAFQPIAREIASVPVFMSAMMQCPMVSVAFDKYDKVMILTANGQSLKPQKDCLLNSCGFDVDEKRFVIFGCQNVPGFDAVAKGEKVDVEFVTPGIVELAKDILKKYSTIRAIILECTELPPYADALRKETGLPVFDAITCADFFISAMKDNPRFGLNQWQNDWDGLVKEYKLGDNLGQDQRRKLLNA